MTRFVRTISSAALLILSGIAAGQDNQDNDAKVIRQLLDEALKAAADIPPDYERALALAEIGSVQFLSGDHKAAKATFERAVTTARTLPTGDEGEAAGRCSLLLRIARYMGTGGDSAGALALLDDIVANEPLTNFRPIHD